MTYHVDPVNPKVLEDRVPGHLSGGYGSERGIKRGLHFAKPVSSIQWLSRGVFWFGEASRPTIQVASSLDFMLPEEPVPP